MKFGKLLLTAALISAATLSYAGSDWLSKVTDAINNESSVTNQDSTAIQVSINDIKSSGTKYINRRVQITGKIVSVSITKTEGIFAVTIADDKGATLQALVNTPPSCNILATVTAAGIYNGVALEEANVVYKLLGSSEE